MLKLSQSIASLSLVWRMTKVLPLVLMSPCPWASCPLEGRLPPSADAEGTSCMPETSAANVFLARSLRRASDEVFPRARTVSGAAIQHCRDSFQTVLKFIFTVFQRAVGPSWRGINVRSANLLTKNLNVYYLSICFGLGFYPGREIQSMSIDECF